MAITCRGKNVLRTSFTLQIPFDYEVLQLQHGRKVLSYKNHTYSYQGNQSCNNRYLCCSRKFSAKCKAKLKLNQNGEIILAEVDHTHKPTFYKKCSDDYEVLQLEQGKKVIRYKNYTFSCQSRSKFNTYLYCSRKVTARCKAKLRMNQNGEIILAEVDHTHGPPVYKKSTDDYEVLQLEHGKKVVRYKNHTFSCHSKSKFNSYLYCSRKFRANCKAKLRINQNGEIIFAEVHHTHEPPVYKKSMDDYEVLQLEHGRQIVRYKNHTYSYQGKSRSNCYLYCSRRFRAKCKAKLRMNQNCEIILAELDHTHIPTLYKKSSDGYEVLLLHHRRKIIRYQNHTFSQHGSHSGSNSYLYCSSKISAKCKAKLRLNKRGEIILAEVDHTHAPSIYQKCADGKGFFKIFELSSIVKKEKRMCGFRQSWIGAYPWIEPLEERGKVYCKLCTRVLNIGHGGINDVERHRKTNKHLKKEELEK